MAVRDCDKDWGQVWAGKMEEWNRRRAGKMGGLGSRKFWDGFDLWEEYEAYTGYPGKLIEPVLRRIDADTTVLDIGAGSGSVAAPLTRASKWVTALEPSTAQINRLGRRIEREGLQNVRVVESRWEDARIEDIGAHDVVIASYSLFMMDIEACLRKMYEVARKRIYLVHLAGHNLQPYVRKVGCDDAAMPDLATLLNVLGKMGLKNEERIFRRDFELPLDLQLNMFRYAQSFSEAQIEALREKLENSDLTYGREGVTWLRRQYRDDLISIVRD